MKKRILYAVMGGLFLAQTFLVSDAKAKESTSGETVEEVTEDFSDFIITEQPFLTFEGMRAKESRTQVFTIWNMGESAAAYTLLVHTSQNVELELEKRGDYFYNGTCYPLKEAEINPLELAVLEPGETVVFSLSLINNKETPVDASVSFEEKENLSCDTN